MTFEEEEIKEALEHRNVLMDIRSVLETTQGKNFFKYLFKYLDVGELPPIGSEGSMLMDRLGFLRAGNSIFKLAAEADAKVAGVLLAELEKERYDRLTRELDDHNRVHNTSTSRRAKNDRG
jgi:hypothetical protein